ncbi:MULTISPECIES: hypothetical protein [unclassified Aminobacter]|jgi:hypothetical protein|uniref:hypothetical protein n=1 Tax=unclassified Aminobacter TaxID=2644704 RepID=UPI0011998C2B|nr:MULTISPECIES: hypothetical protein [unclassified Aminobacter]TWG55360.1 hypothetical protein L610_003000000120 [Aminobacter sp. J44]TWH33890.1 hypothetical protein L611_001900000410 [Aminobacter sp. J15]
MSSQMNLVHEAARMAMADHRAASPRGAAPKSRWHFFLAYFEKILRLLQRA